MSEINLIYLLSAMTFGMIHSLEPGHGKGLITTYILGTDEPKRRDILLIGIIATITHTIVIFTLAFLGFKVIDFFAPDKSEIWIRTLASLIILSIGLWLIWDKILHGVIHEHHHDHEHDDCCIHDKITKNVKSSSVPVIGIISGMVPCSGGLAIVITAVATGEFTKLFHSFIYIFSFSMGLGITLIAVAFGVMYGKSVLTEALQNSFKNIEKASIYISAILIYSLGLVLLTYNLTPFVSTKLELFHKHEHCDHGCTHNH